MERAETLVVCVIHNSGLSDNGKNAYDFRLIIQDWQEREM